MEVNKEEAERCLAISRTHMDSGNLPSALKFAKKSVALYSTPAATAWLQKLESASETKSSAGSSSARPSGAEAHPSASTTSHRHSNGTSNGNDTPKREYTPEQMKIVKRVRACKITAYYDILDLKTECDENDVKKAYRKVRGHRSLFVSFNLRLEF